MSSSLDKLKALTSKLDDRLAKKNASVYTPNPLLTKSETEPLKEPAKPIITPLVSKPKPALTVLVKEENAEKIRTENIERVKILYEDLKIFDKSPDFDTIFMYKAMNLSGIGLKEEDFGVVRAGKYVQVIAITYEPDASGKKKAKNISLGYYGKGETINPDLKNRIIEFVLRWRYEKAFQNVEHYKVLLSKLDRPKTLF